MKFNQKEVSLIISLIKGKKETDSFLRGFRRRNKAEKDRDEFYDKLIDKVSVLSVKEIKF